MLEMIIVLSLKPKEPLDLLSPPRWTPSTVPSSSLTMKQVRSMVLMELSLQDMRQRGKLSSQRGQTGRFSRTSLFFQMSRIEMCPPRSPSLWKSFKSSSKSAWGGSMPPQEELIGPHLPRSQHQNLRRFRIHRMSSRGPSSPVRTNLRYPHVSLFPLAP